MKKKRRLKRSVIILFILLVFIIVGVLGFLFIKDKKAEEKKIKIEKLITNINKHYDGTVKVNKDSELYELTNGDYKKIGTISKDTIFNLEKIKINQDTKYFKIKENGFYISYNDVSPTKDTVVSNDRYKNYIKFNENVKCTNTKLYKDGKLVYSLDKELDSPIIKKGEDGYYVEMFNDLYLVKSEDKTTTYSHDNGDTREVATNIPVTCNHFIYLEGDTSCNESICHPEKQIREEYQYLKDNKYFTLTTTELREWIEGKINLPKNSILITIDDGARAWNFIPLLEEYKINATLFLITGWYDLDRFQSPYLELASHTHDLHVGGKCPGGQGSGLKCLPENVLLEDLKKSRDKLNGTEAFCYPFYEFNDYSTGIIKKAGFKMAFIGGMRKVTRQTDLYHIPRISFNRTTTLDEYIKWIK